MCIKQANHANTRNYISVSSDKITDNNVTEKNTHEIGLTWH